FFQAEDGIRDPLVTGVQTCALPICWAHPHAVMAGNTPMEQVGDVVVAWDYKTGKVLQVEHLDKAPLEVRWLHGAGARGGFVNCAFGNSVWHWEVGKDGKLAFARVIKLADG